MFRVALDVWVQTKDYKSYSWFYENNSLLPFLNYAMRKEVLISRQSIKYKFILNLVV